MSYVKSFAVNLDSKVWEQPNPTRLVWVAMLAMADKGGVIHASLPGIAARAGVTLDEARVAIEWLSRPDPRNANKGSDGRRIIDVDGGFEILSHS